MRVLIVLSIVVGVFVMVLPWLQSYMRMLIAEHDLMEQYDEDL